ncbi:hypothetical protein BC1002_7018 (plasmid) [Paraburkholderia atlantica]|uniref:Uncharacterized protein n=2 Tax=Paraburkholderia atlantica TaxID=2654982 RepID=D5WNB9_PARAM|nr:hypothetical protein [Paraburkholderia atlantica]ADG20798.1 hypothetical protein BC1002_7018 [Paraburkholderia atlantica]
MEQRFTEGQLIGFLKEADAGMPVKELLRFTKFMTTDSLLVR